MEMTFKWRRWAMYGRKIFGKTDGPIDNRIVARTCRSIGGKIAARTAVVSSVGWIEPIKWQVSMVSKGEIVPV
jgi:hypothetical protein